MSKSTKTSGGRYILKQREILKTSGIAYAKLFEIATKVAYTIYIVGLETEDKVSEAFFKMIFNISKIKKADNPEAKAYSIAKGHLLNLYSREKKFGQKQFELVSDEDTTECKEPKSTINKFWQSYKVDNLVIALNQALAKLPSRERDVLQYYYGLEDTDEHTFSQIAESLHISITWACELKGRGIAKIRTLLGVDTE